MTGVSRRTFELGEFVPLSRLKVSTLREKIQQVLSEKSYKQNAVRLQEFIRNTEGVKKAADIIEFHNR